MFEFVKSLSGENFQTPIILPSTASETYTDGEGLVMSSGALTKVGATAAPTYICGEAYVAPASENRDIVAYPVLPHHVYKTTFAADGTSTAEGAKVTLHTDGAQITATTASGVATIVKKLGTGAVGTEALVRFI
jgi:hypothetical protein